LTENADLCSLKRSRPNDYDGPKLGDDETRRPRPKLPLRRKSNELVPSTKPSKAYQSKKFERNELPNQMPRKLLEMLLFVISKNERRNLLKKRRKELAKRNLLLQHPSNSLKYQNNDKLYQKPTLNDKSHGVTYMYCLDQKKKK